MSLTDSVQDVAQYVIDTLNAGKTDSGLQDVWYQDQNLIPRYPAACVIPGDKSREYNGNARRTLVTMEVYVNIYFGKVQDVQQNNIATVDIAEIVESQLHQSSQCGPADNPLVIQSLVTDVSPGYANRSGTLVAATRLTFQATSQKSLPPYSGSA